MEIQMPGGYNGIMMNTIFSLSRQNFKQKSHSRSRMSKSGSFGEPYKVLEHITQDSVLEKNEFVGAVEWHFTQFLSKIIINTMINELGNCSTYMPINLLKQDLDSSMFGLLKEAKDVYPLQDYLKTEYQEVQNFGFCEQTGSKQILSQLLRF